MRAVVEVERVTPGRIAYEADVAACPLYYDGEPRKSWHELETHIQGAWERKSPREHASTQINAVKAELLAAQQEWQKAERICDAAPDMLASLKAIVAEPHGCVFCDSGKLRNPAKAHEDDCGFAMASAAIARAEGRTNA